MVKPAPLQAALDIGSNTIRLLVARNTDTGLERIQDCSEFVRLGKGVDASGRLQPDRMDAALAAIRTLTTRAKEAGAGTPITVATSAVRDASNREEFLRRVREEAGIDVRVLSGEEEARLTFLGATLGTNLDGGAIVADLGGGSAEVIAAGPKGIRWARSLQIGSGRLTEQFVHHDPPEPAELDAIAAHVTALLEDLPPAQAGTAIFTGGTASHIAWLLGRQGEQVHIVPADLRRVVDLLASRSAAEIVRSGVAPERAEVLPGGVRAIQTIADFYDVSHITITRGGIREGTILDAQELGG